MTALRTGFSNSISSGLALPARIVLISRHVSTITTEVMMHTTHAIIPATCSHLNHRQPPDTHAHMADTAHSHATLRQDRKITGSSHVRSDRHWTKGPRYVNQARQSGCKGDYQAAVGALSARTSILSSISAVIFALQSSSFIATPPTRHTVGSSSSI